MVELFTPSIAIVTQLKKLHHFSHLALETSLQCNCSSKYSAGLLYCIEQPPPHTYNIFLESFKKEIFKRKYFWQQILWTDLAWSSWKIYVSSIGKLVVLKITKKRLDKILDFFLEPFQKKIFTGNYFSWLSGNFQSIN